MSEAEYRGPERRASPPVEPQTLEKIGAAVENVQKVARPLWAVAVGLIGIGVWFGKFYSEYQYNAEHGSPAVRDVIAGQQKQIDSLAKLVELSEQRSKFDERRNELIEARLSRLEDRK